MDQSRTVLLTGFEPFGGDASNPSWTVARQLHGLQVEGARVESRCLPVDGQNAPRVLGQAVQDVKPAAIMMLGLARGRVQVALERVAVNRMDYRIADNAGRVRSNEPIEPDGPDAYLSTLPLDAILERWRSDGLPGYVSNTAGLYLCNQVFYAARHTTPLPAGFIHLPSDESLVADRLEAFVPLEFQRFMVRAAIEVTAQHLIVPTSSRQQARRKRSS